MPIRIAFIGAGSIGFTRKLIHDVLQVPELRDTHFALHDISERNLDMVAQILEKDLQANDLPATISRHVDRRPALDGARYVVNTTRIGGLEAFKDDIDIPLQYGVDQCVGDTLCIGGIMYGQRNIPQVLAFQKDMAELCDQDHPAGALFLNYANPMAMNTWAALDAYDRGEGIHTVGLCHGVEGGWRQIATVLATLHGDTELLEEQGHTGLVDIVCAGINHQTWYTDVVYRGRRIEADELLEAFEAHEHLCEKEPVRIDVLRRFGCYSTESNGHLSEYVPWYRKSFGDARDDVRQRAADRWVGPHSWIHGETGGYLRVCTEGRHWFVDDFPKWLDEAGQPMDTWGRSAEHGSYIIEGYETGRPYRGHFNTRNMPRPSSSHPATASGGGQIITNLPGDCIVEAPGYADRFGLQMAAGLELPPACAATCQASINVQRMAKDAATAGDRMLLKQAVLHDPLTAAVLEPEPIWQMVDHMLVQQADHLPQYQDSGAVDAARQSLATHDQQGTRVPLRADFEGAARQHTKSVEQLREAKDTSVMDADKAAAQRARDAKQIAQRVAG
jgi:alpha-galactosidase